MEAKSLALLFLAAVLHALANVLLKQARDKLAFTWWMLGVSSVFGMPLWLYSHDISATGWLIILLSGLLEAVYFVALSRAYTYGDLSQVYPIARGSAPLFIMVWAVTILGERPSPGGVLGVLAIVSGLYLVNLPRLADWTRPLLHARSRATRWALLTGVLISAYAITDKVGVQQVDPIVYLYLILFVGWLALTPLWLCRAQRQALVNEIFEPGAGPRLRSMAAIGGAALLGVAAYGLVLAAFQVSDVGYVGAVREVSVVIGAWIGVRFLGEAGGSVRVLASVLVFCGILLIAIAG
jgi:drug/metabolite transporter (DMT)-like permease